MLIGQNKKHQVNVCKSLLRIILISQHVFLHSSFLPFLPQSLIFSTFFFIVYIEACKHSQGGTLQRQKVHILQFEYSKAAVKAANHYVALCSIVTFKGQTHTPICFRGNKSHLLQFLAIFSHDLDSWGSRSHLKVPNKGYLVPMCLPSSIGGLPGLDLGI